MAPVSFEQFLTALDKKKPVDLWHNALRWKYRGGSNIKYYFKRLRLFMLAEPQLPALF